MSTQNNPLVNITLPMTAMPMAGARIGDTVEPARKLTDSPQAQHFDLDLSFEYEHLFQRSQTNYETHLSGSFKSDVYIPGISLAYHW